MVIQSSKNDAYIVIKERAIGNAVKILWCDVSPVCWICPSNKLNTFGFQLCFDSTLAEYKNLVFWPWKL